MRRERRNRFTKPGAPPTWTSAHSSFSSSFSSWSFSLSFPLLSRRRHDRMSWMPPPYNVARLPFPYRFSSLPASHLRLIPVITSYVSCVGVTFRFFFFFYSI
ncbi:hypothetical protein PUN28_018134 [Cardiocondyla obscurior]|uniref:Transmembrane protein n=1 Tax=Cardiocondyla obscurior TaxID=286306 RepID=A0AAW2ELD2_9HYME